MLNRSKLAAAAMAFVAPCAPASATSLFGLSYSTEITASPYSIVGFDSSAPGIETSRRSITGLGDAVLRAIDYRSNDATLYAFASNNNVYALTLTNSTFTAALVTTLTGAPPVADGTDVAFDFNPVNSRARIITTGGENYRLSVGTIPGQPNGAVTFDGIVRVNGSEDALIVGAAYTNSVMGAASTDLYGIDLATNTLVLADLPQALNWASVGTGLDVDGGINGSNAIGFEIVGQTGEAFLSVDAMLYRVDLTTGTATGIGEIASGRLLDITTAAAAVPEPATWAMLIGGTGVIGGAARRRRRRLPAASPC